MKDVMELWGIYTVEVVKGVRDLLGIKEVVVDRREL
jgi:hypothetical protein